ncbi:MAG: FKBP-type peptidyl-prolyl cis-trans isomerase [Bacteroidales bacterium]
MKLKLVFLTTIVGAITLNSCSSDSLSSSSSATDSVSYAFGINIGESLKRTNIDGLNPDIIATGIRDVVTKNGENALMTNEESMMLLQEYFKRQHEEALAKNSKEGEAFLENNKTAAGVITTSSGLQYKIITEGKGIKPSASDEVEVHYRGTLLNGDVFDSSYERGEPIKLRLNSVIAGWTEGLQLVKEGSKVMFWIPSHLGYGESNAGTIEPNSTLIFEIELIKVHKGGK